MKDRREVGEVKDTKEVKEGNRRIAAFFDSDGTLIPLPSMERRFFRILQYRQEILLMNYFLWMSEALRLLPRGISALVHANKMYLRGVQGFDRSEFENRGDNSPAAGSFDESDFGNRARSFSEQGICDESDAEDCGVLSAHASGHPEMLPLKLGASRGSQAGGQASAAPPKRSRRNPRLPVPLFFERGVERVAWHATQGHAIVLVSGTLEVLAGAVACELEAALAARGIATKIRVCATKVEESGGKFTGHIADEAMFGEAKARAVRALAREMRLDLDQCYAYGDSKKDESMLECAGNPVAVNPSPGLARIACQRGWPVLNWDEERELTQRTQSSRAQRPQRREPSNADGLIRASASGEASGQLGVSG